MTLGRALVAGALGGLLSLASPTTALAYCRTAACEGGVGARCEPALPSDCGKPLYWPTSCVGWVLQEDASEDFEIETARSLVTKAFDAWTSAECEGGQVAVTTEDLGDVACDEIGYDPETRNANVILFRDDDWPYAGGENSLAITTVTYVVDTGEIRDADMEVNTRDVDFSTSNSDVTVDLLSILTHEAGHFLGLAHSSVPSSTMVVEYPPESLSLRSLDDDDLAGICAIYPAGSPATCDSAPVNGLGDDCAESPDDGCSCATPRGRAASASLGALLLGLAAARRAAARARARRRQKRRELRVAARDME